MISCRSSLPMVVTVGSHRHRSLSSSLPLPIVATAVGCRQSPTDATVATGFDCFFVTVISAVTCLYRTRLSTQKELLVRVTWSKSLLGQGLSVGVDHCSSPQHPPQKTAGATNSMLLRKKKGNHTFLSGEIEVGLHWDISAAKYGFGPEPVEGFYLVVTVEAEVALVLGDISREHIKGLEGGSGGLPVAEFSLVSRREQVLGGTPYATKARFGDNGRDHEILIRCKGGEGGVGGSRDAELSVSIDRKKVVQVRRLRWNFRGNQTIFVDGLPVDMMWDVHDWWFSDTSGRAAFMFRTRSALESRLWLEEELLHREQGGKSGFSLLIHAFKSP
ncbi:hypothetical protein Taro_047909 [Colocasia esculenta]|uniref:DUF868 domain-containing protein n=1 Tax=Colocasia esculenta TaxID=4460 RepID=A0A843WU94_COLES|nr:hypothetical protein [Colocasia esculenta]